MATVKINVDILYYAMLFSLLESDGINTRAYRTEYLSTTIQGNGCILMPKKIQSHAIWVSQVKINTKTVAGARPGGGGGF